MRLENAVRLLSKFGSVHCGRGPWGRWRRIRIGDHWLSFSVWRLSPTRVVVGAIHTMPYRADEPWAPLGQPAGHYRYHSTLVAAIRHASASVYAREVNGRQVRVKTSREGPTAAWERVTVEIDGRWVAGPDSAEAALARLAKGVVEKDSPAILLDWVAEHTASESPHHILLAEHAGP